MQHTGTTQTTYHTLVITDEEREKLLETLNMCSEGSLNAQTRTFVLLLEDLAPVHYAEDPRATY